jgi:putative Mn2+ efflux pump MntP
MTAKSYSRLAAVIFAVIAVLQMIRAASGWPITVGATTSIPLWASWIACVIAGVLAWVGFDASR